MLLDTRFMLSTKGDIAPFCKIFLFVDSTCCQQDFLFMRSGVHAPAAFLKVFYLGRCDLSKNKLNFFGGQSRHTQ